MSNPRDFRDRVVLVMTCSGWVAATVFLFQNPASVNFATWSGLVATIGGIFHWICVYDDKRVDAGNVAAVLPAEGLTDVIANEQREWKGEDHGTA